MAELEFFCCVTHDQFTQIVIVRVKYVIYQKRKDMSIVDAEQTLLKNLNITRFKEMTTNNVDTFDNILKPFI